MSGHTIEHDCYIITVGWDNSLQTFFALLFERSAKDGSQDKEASIILGAPREFQDIEQFADLFEREARRDGFWGVYIPDELQQTLERDRIFETSKVQEPPAVILDFLKANEGNG
ncbi:MAG: hypothetical protein SWY16_04560 [Cyanobacteriota bacterium]|nr:hypothetical protein [Cyanobacteriota bacterium]